ncbi:MAG: O-antigen polymerase [Bacteroidales bacterium]|nr:O-antigen polymerase [Bacteroidales bacterium]
MKCSKTNVFSPAVITGFMWFASILLYLTLGQKLPALSNNLAICLTLWICGICFSSLYMQSATYRDSDLTDASVLIRNVYLILSIAAIPELINFVKVVLVCGTSGNLAWDLRLAAIGEGSGFNKPFGGWFVVVWQATLLLEILFFEKKKWWRLAIIAVIFSCFGVVTMSKITFSSMFIFACTILFFKKKITLKHLGIGASCLFFLFFLIQAARAAVEVSNVGGNSFFLNYIVSNLTAFDSLHPCSAEHFGENTFRFVYAVFYDLGLSDIKPINTLLKWVIKPIPTNTYTAMYPFYVDFGIIGLIIFPIIMGCTYGWIYKKADKGNNFYILVYATMVNMLIMQYAADLFFTCFFGNVKLILLLIIPFLEKKYNFLSFNKKTVQQYD